MKCINIFNVNIVLYLYYISYKEGRYFLDSVR